ncbi:MAG: hypothetical protein SGJ27_15370 [Candidatus Melainabacteria bacterium]|nr:hypothetical protein [Candidatus Melainabacteria bacterium]
MTSTELIRNVSEVLKAKVAYPAFSFFFRIHSGSEKQLHDAGHIRNRVHQVLKESNLSSTTLEAIKTRADQLIDQLNFEIGALSVGLFVSVTESYLSHYFVNLPERDFVGDYFSGYETMYAEQESAPYLLILLEPAVLRIFQGRAEHLVAVPDSEATKHLLSVYRRRLPAPADKDGKVKKGHNHDAHWKQELLEAIASVCCSEQMPAYFAGLCLADLNETELTSHGVEVLAALDESYQFTGAETLKTLSQDLRFQHHAKKSKLLHERCKVAKGNQKLASGADEVLACAKEGRGEVLILPYPKRELTGTLKLDAMQETIRAVNLTHGSIEFLPADLMDEYDDAAMILRY